MILNRETYKAVKHMDKKQMTEYLARLYRRGFEDGKHASAEHLKRKAEEQRTAAKESQGGADGVSTVPAVQD